MNPIPDRNDMAHFAQTYFYQTGNAVEVGVYEGQFAAHNLKTWAGNYMMVDTWEHRPDGTIDKNDENAEHWRAIMARAERNTANYYQRRGMAKGYSVDVARAQKDGSFDWVYLDAGHDEYNMRADLNAWWPKLRSGGLFSGDDYGLHEDCQELYPLSAERFDKKHGPYAKIYQWGTAKALHEFCAENGLVLHITWLNDKSNPAWYLIKP